MTEVTHAEVYAQVRRIAVEHLKDHPHIERTHRLMQLPQSLASEAPLRAEIERLRGLLREVGDCRPLDSYHYDDLQDRIDTELKGKPQARQALGDKI